MKYLAEPRLDQLSTLLSSAASSPAAVAEARVTVKFELYSVKPIREDRRMVKEREEMYMSEQEGMEEMSFSPEMKEAGLSSCFGRLDEKESRKVHYLLVQTLNSAFPEHEFAALQPEHFTREPSAAVVLEQMSGRLLYKTGALPQLAPSHSSPLLRPVGSGNPGSSPFSSSPSFSNAPLGPAGDLYKSLCEVVPLDECDVYSWLPSPEYDPHVEPDDGELEEDGWMGYGYDDGAGEGGMDVDMDMDVDSPSNSQPSTAKRRDDTDGGEAMWGNAGMEIEEEIIPLHGGGVEISRVDAKGKRRTSDMPPPALPPSGPLSSSAMSKRGSIDDEMMGLERTGGGLLWSANYFFYSKRNKRILFVTCWSRKRSGPRHYALPPSDGAFPETISSSSFSTSAGGQQPSSSPLAPRRYKQRKNSRHKPHARPSLGSGSERERDRGLGGGSGSGTNKQRGFPGSVGRTSIFSGSSGTIPIRSMQTPSRSSVPPPLTPNGRLATSAPASGGLGFGMTSPAHQQQATPGAMSRMTAGGFKPKAQPNSNPGLSPTVRPGGFAPMQMQAHGQPHRGQSGIAAGLASFTGSANALRLGSTGPAAQTGAGGAGILGGGDQEGESRVRKDRSESTTPGPAVMRSGGAGGADPLGSTGGVGGAGDVGKTGQAEGAAGKRVKV